MATKPANQAPAPVTKQKGVTQLEIMLTLLIIVGIVYPLAFFYVYLPTQCGGAA